MAEIELNKKGEIIAPIADHFRCSLCPECPNLHVLLLDAKDKPLAQATFTAMQLVTMTEMAVRAADGYGDAVPGRG